MQLTLLTTLFAAAATAAPALEARQGVPRVRATFYDGGGCAQVNFPWREDFVFTQDHPIGQCIDLTFGPFGSTYFNESSLTRSLRFYNLPCSADEESGNHFDIGPSNGATPGCFAQAIRSYKVL
ncbi:hypothetical protein ACN47E_001293 [Coniothyrium glycines]